MKRVSTASLVLLFLSLVALACVIVHETVPAYAQLQDISAGDSSWGNTACNGGQTSCPQTTHIVEYDTVASGDDATLPAAHAGQHSITINRGANDLSLWPDTGDDAGAGVNIALTLPPGSRAICYAVDTTYWDCRIEGVPFPITYTAYMENSVRLLDQKVWGAIRVLETGATLSGFVDIVVTNGISKVMFVPNTCSDATGSVTITGTSVNRVTGAETGSDTDVLSWAGTCTDGSDTDAQSNPRYSFTDCYLSSKWFKGSITVDTSDVTCTDVDTYALMFDQANDAPAYEIDTIDITAQTTSALGWFYAYLYTVEVTSGVVDIARAASLEVAVADTAANDYYRLRRGELGLSLSGSTDGFFLDLNPGPDSAQYWRDISVTLHILQEAP